MRIAIPTNDGSTISQHFGRSAAFLTFDIENGEIKDRGLRPNGMEHTHEQGQCSAAGAGHEQHSHAGIVTTLAGCDAVICAGMGWKAAEALESAGIECITTPQAGRAEDAVRAYLGGTLQTGGPGFCRCGH
jgi:predicted Fe-Mo cluster-binding NifX family protein